jgi:hypothetical protein
MKQSCLNCANCFICATILEQEEDLTFEKVDNLCKFIGGFKERNK